MGCVNVEFGASRDYVALLSIELLRQGRCLFDHKARHLLLFAGVTTVCILVSIVDILHVARER